ncbi:hypothetical protein [Halochromatium salexigens]|uniref:hypothetical protein n=1 Tax=Halochromatium salexigens TaxID=49447 RepID=UPI0019117DB3|nr:hypothetical protein [Halochromatium salexigens]
MNLNQLLAGSLGLLFTGLSSAAPLPLKNGDFGSFEGWSGERFDGTSPITGNELDDVAVDTDNNFRRDAAAGTGTAVNSSSYSTVDLFQNFTVPDAEGGSVWLSFDYGWSMTDSSSDLVSIILFDTTFFPLVDLVGPSNFPWITPVVAAESNSGSGSLSYDVTAYENQEVILSAFVDNGDFDTNIEPITGDSVTIGNITLNQVPAPPTAFLLLAGFPLILHWRVRNKG